MGKIFVLIGKSASGKDAIYKRLINDTSLGLKPYIGYTTRPMRTGETDGKEYFFTDTNKLREFENSGKLIEKRVYHTVYGDWTYYSVDNKNVDLSKDSFLYIGTLESFVPIRNYYGKDNVIPIYIYVEDGERLSRAISRERTQSNPKYTELCRRFLKDAEDFSEENISSAGITVKFENNDLEECSSKIKKYILLT